MSTTVGANIKLTFCFRKTIILRNENWRFVLRFTEWTQAFRIPFYGMLRNERKTQTV